MWNRCRFFNEKDRVLREGHVSKTGMGDYFNDNYGRKIHTDEACFRRGGAEFQVEYGNTRNHNMAVRIPMSGLRSPACVE